MSLADDILAADDLPIEEVKTPEWTACPSVWVRTLAAGERDQFESDTLVKSGKSREVNLLRLRARLVAASACGSAELARAGTPIFKPEQVDQLCKKSSKVIDRIFAVAQRLCGMTDEDVTALVKNS